MIRRSELPDDYRRLIERYDIDIGKINKGIKAYNPVVVYVSVDDGEGFTVFIADATGNLPSFNVDYWQDGDVIQCDWNEFITDLRDSRAFIRMLYRNDAEVFDKATSTGYDYLQNKGYIEKIGRAEKLCYRPHPKTVKSPAVKKSVKVKPFAKKKKMSKRR